MFQVNYTELCIAVSDRVTFHRKVNANHPAERESRAVCSLQLAVQTALFMNSWFCTSYVTSRWGMGPCIMMVLWSGSHNSILRTVIVLIVTNLSVKPVLWGDFQHILKVGKTSFSEYYSFCWQHRHQYLFLSIWKKI